MNDIAEGLKRFVQEEIVSSPDCLMLVESEATVDGSSDSALSPLYEASAKFRQAFSCRASPRVYTSMPPVC